MASGHRAAVLGRPVAHSLSPVLHRAAYAALGLSDWSYEAIECDEGQLHAVLAERADWAGFSCTMPLKHAALAVASDLTSVAAAVGAANTLLPRRGGGWTADNTDVAGITAALDEHDVDAPQVTVLGAGGTAQAVVAALAGRGVERCMVLVRDPGRTTALRDTAAAFDVTLEVAQLHAGAPALSAALVISTLPPRAADPLAAGGWTPGQMLLDVVYDPWPTAIADAVSAAGGRVISGAVMLLHQAARQVELMTGQAAPVEAMRTALRAAVPHAGAV